MAQIILNIPDANNTRLVAGYAQARGWTPASPLTRAQYARQDMLKWFIDNAKAGDIQLQTLSAIATAASDADSITTGLTAS